MSNRINFAYMEYDDGPLAALVKIKNRNRMQIKLEADFKYVFTVVRYNWK